MSRHPRRRSESARPVAWALAAILAWALFAFGAVYPWASRPVVIAASALFLYARPRLLFSPQTRVLDWALTAIGAIALAQLIPLPPGVQSLLSPHARGVVSGLSIVPIPATAWLPLTVSPRETLDAAGIVIAAILLFWIARDSLHVSGQRIVARAVAIMGLGAALLAVLDPALFPNGKVYGFWHPQARESHTVGPIISSNHFAAWMIMGIALTSGYLVAHARSHWRAKGAKLAAKVLSDFRSLWLVAACVIMLAGIFVSTSRAGMIGVTVAMLFGGIRSWRGLSGTGRAGVLGFLLILAVAPAFLSSPDNVAVRLGNSVSDSWGGRPMIWRDTLEMSRPYRLTGVGLGAFDTAMSVHQPMPRPTLINHAHNQYLEVLAEGGFVLVVPVAIAGLALLILISRRLVRDESALSSLRQGALAGMVGLATQSVWETPLLTPAVFFLLAVVAGIAANSRHEEGAAG